MELKFNGKYRGVSGQVKKILALTDKEVGYEVIVKGTGKGRHPEVGFKGGCPRKAFENWAKEAVK